MALLAHLGQTRNVKPRNSTASDDLISFVPVKAFLGASCGCCCGLESGGCLADPILPSYKFMLASAWGLLVHCLPLLVNACVFDSMHPRLFKPFQESIFRHVRIQVADNIPNIARIHGKITNRRKLESALEDISRPPSFSFITDDPLWSTYYVCTVLSRHSFVSTDGAAAGHWRMTRLLLALALFVIKEPFVDPRRPSREPLLRLPESPSKMMQRSTRQLCRVAPSLGFFC